MEAGEFHAISSTTLPYSISIIVIVIIVVVVVIIIIIIIIIIVVIVIIIIIIIIIIGTIVIIISKQGLVNLSGKNCGSRQSVLLILMYHNVTVVGRKNGLTARRRRRDNEADERRHMMMMTTTTTTTTMTMTMTMTMTSNIFRTIINILLDCLFQFAVKLKIFGKIRQQAAKIHIFVLDLTEFQRNYAVIIFYWRWNKFLFHWNDRQNVLDNNLGMVNKSRFFANFENNITTLRSAFESKKKLNSNFLIFEKESGLGVFIRGGGGGEGVALKMISFFIYSNIFPIYSKQFAYFQYVWNASSSKRVKTMSNFQGQRLIIKRN